MLENIKAVIFDLDGTLVDSMWVWEKIDNDYLKKMGYEVPLNLKDEISHLSFNQVAEYFKDKFNIVDSLEVIKDTWHNMAISEYSNNIPLKPGAEAFLKHIKNLGLKIALATSNSVPLLEAVLVKHNIYEYFDVIVTTNEVERGKNFPDIYLLCAERLEVKPEECLVFEDLYAAVMGAKAAGMKVAAMHDPSSEYQREELERLADHYVMSYDEIFEK
ncbi:HAD family hydrolase [Clostridium polynesiense]|uniref:HAD family hydrolase n=1 Tax=Clostridium polynesiense TaxID=1325933 RepID=UPI0005902E70|nr:HAD family phosphatase [Clostridium polynesiense]